MKLHAASATDGYKLSHGKMYADGTTKVYSNLTPRTDRIFRKNCTPFYDGKLVWVGAQGAVQEIKEMWDEFFASPKEKVVGRFARRMAGYLGGYEPAVEAISALHDVGYLPLTFKSLPEGSKVSFSIPVLTVTNTLPQFYWLTNYLETVISDLTWKTATNATIAAEYKAICKHYAGLTGTDDFTVSIQCHDFSMRGMSGIEDSARSGFGHLIQFIGTDTLPAMDYAEDYYDADPNSLIAISVPATEHAVATSNILGIEHKNDWPAGCDSKIASETMFMYDLITRKFPTGIVSYVADSFDFWAVLTDILPALKDVIMAREASAVAPGKLVIRPDCYSEDTSILTPDGWKQFCELKEDDLVAQVTDSGEYGFVKPLKIVNQEYVGKMHHFKDHHGKVDLLVTPNHRMVLEQKGKERIVYAEKLKMRGNSEQKMFRSAKATGQTTKLTDLERLKIAFQADGSFVTKQDTCIRFSFSKARKITRMRELLNRAGYSYNEYNLSDGKVEFNIKLAASNFQKDFDWVVFDQLDSNWACEFIDELSHWDSSVRNEGRFKFDTTTESVINKVELIAIAAGKGVLISETEDNRKEHFSKVYTAHIMDNNSVGGQSWTNEVVDYSGRVYCVTVPSGKVLVKRNGCTMVSGNSGDPVKVVCGMDYTSYEEALDKWVDYDELPDCRYDVLEKDGKFYRFETDATYYPDWTTDHNITLKEEVDLCEVKGAVQLLWETFGGTTTDKGYKLLDSHIGLIYGDSITTKRAEEILRRLVEKGFASGNVVFGVGSYTYQCNTRDTFGFAVKATYTEVGEEKIAIFKDPKTDSKKKSAKGLLCVHREENGEFVLQDDVSIETESSEMNWLQPIFKDGEFVKRTTLQEIRDRLNVIRL